VPPVVAPVVAPVVPPVVDPVVEPPFVRAPMPAARCSAVRRAPHALASSARQKKIATNVLECAFTRWLPEDVPLVQPNQRPQTAARLTSLEPLLFDAFPSKACPRRGLVPAGVRGCAPR